MTNEEIDRAMKTGSAGAGLYFEAYCEWSKLHWNSLNALHKVFEKETEIQLDFTVFASQMFNETTDGQKMAERHLGPLLESASNKLSDEELGKRLRIAMSRLIDAGICHRLIFNEKTESHFPHSAYNFRIGWENNGAVTFEAHEDASGTGWKTLVSGGDLLKPYDAAQSLLITLELAAKYLETLDENS